MESSELYICTQHGFYTSTQTSNALKYKQFLLALLQFTSLCDITLLSLRGLKTRQINGYLVVALL